MILIKRIILEYPCIRKLIKNGYYLFTFNIFKKKRISLITEADLNKLSLIRTCTLDNSLYGIDKIYQKAYDKEFFFEHGYYWGNVIPQGEKAKIIKTIFTISKRRELFLKENLNKNVKYIDPYIVNANICKITKNNILNLRLSANKPIRLFIPGHYEKKNSYCIVNPVPDVEFTTIVLLYYLDYDRVDKVDGNIYISCGQAYDPKFLERLKSLLIYSDYIETNFLGTHIIYANALGLDINFSGNINDSKFQILQIHESLYGFHNTEEKNNLIEDIESVSEKLAY